MFQHYSTSKNVITKLYPDSNNDNTEFHALLGYIKDPDNPYDSE